VCFSKKKAGNTSSPKETSNGELGVPYRFFVNGSDTRKLICLSCETIRPYFQLCGAEAKARNAY
jgi:hypothetical protein